MKNLDITISRKMHIKTAEFNFCETDVSFTLKDVDADKLNASFQILSKIVDAATALEAKSILDESMTVSQNPALYLEGITENEEKIKDSLKKACEILIKKSE